MIAKHEHNLAQQKAMLETVRTQFAEVRDTDDIALWPNTPGLLVKWSSLHLLVGDLDLGVGGVSYVELLILYELLAGERLSLGKAHPRYLRPGRPISVSAVPFGPGIDIWRSYRFIGAFWWAWEVCPLLCWC